MLLLNSIYKYNNIIVNVFDCQSDCQLFVCLIFFQMNLYLYLYLVSCRTQLWFLYNGRECATLKSFSANLDTRCRHIL